MRGCRSVQFEEKPGSSNRLDRCGAEGRPGNRCRLVTTGDNARAIRFYLRRGFSLKDVRISGFEPAKYLKFGGVPPQGNDEIPILHEFEFEMLLS